MDTSIYDSPLKTRYASKEMLKIFSLENRHSIWRELWTELLSAEKELGLEVDDLVIQKMRENIRNIDFELANNYEKKLKHDVMAHIHTFADCVEEARGVIHLGATSCFVTDNSDLIIYREALNLIIYRVKSILYTLREFMKKYKDLPTLSYTHFQPAQVTTVGKRASLWAFDLYLDLIDLKDLVENLYFRGAKGTTGTQDSYVNLLGSKENAKKLDEIISKKFKFKNNIPVSGQTYTRKQDSKIVDTLKHIGETSHKITNDLRLLQHLKELQEHFSENQVGSSAMAYKRNPMRSERVSSLSKFLMSLSFNTALVSSTQWLERSLDDSANRRLTISEAFLTADSILITLKDILDGVGVFTKNIERNLNKYLPFMITEHLIMQGVKNGGDRQELHEKIRIHSIKAQQKLDLGQDNDFIDRLVEDDTIHIDAKEIKELLNPKLYIGRCVEQVDEFIEDYIDKELDGFNDIKVRIDI